MTDLDDSTERQPLKIQNESLREVNAANRRVYLTIIWFLGVSLLLIIGGWIVLAMNGKAMPEGLAAVVGAIAGGLVGAVSGRAR